MRSAFGNARERVSRYGDPVFGCVFAFAWLTGVVSGGTPARQPDLTVWSVCGLLITAPFVWRRRAPLVVGVLVYGAGTALALAIPGRTLPIAMVLASLLAAYTLGTHVAPRRAVPVIAAALVVLAVASAVHHSDSGVAGDVLVPLLFCAAPYAVGRLIARLGHDRSSLQALTVQLEAERQDLARAAVIEERARIARELHDIVAHSISVMVVQAGAAEQFIDPAGRAGPPIEAIRVTGQQALVEMRRLLGILRTDDTAMLTLAPQPGLAGLDHLIDTARHSGLTVTVAVHGEQPRLPPGVDVAAYRLVQESLSNVRKHARTDAAALTLRFDAEVLDIDIADNGVGSSSAGTATGHGLIGMRERVTLYGGQLECGPQRAGGWRVHARLPLSG
jgi:signal transduction histidine kinase